MEAPNKLDFLREAEEKFQVAVKEYEAFLRQDALDEVEVKAALKEIVKEKREAEAKEVENIEEDELVDV